MSKGVVNWCGAREQTAIKSTCYQSRLTCNMSRPCRSLIHFNSFILYYSERALAWEQGSADVGPSSISGRWRLEHPKLFTSGWITTSDDS
jgi:hypothetical protein